MTVITRISRFFLVSQQQVAITLAGDIKLVIIFAVPAFFTNVKFLLADGALDDSQCGFLILVIEATLYDTDQRL